MTRAVLLPPSARLPPLKRIGELPIDAVVALLDYLRAIYSPPVRGTCRVERKVRLADARDASKQEDPLALLRADEFERAHAVRWLTGLISRVTLLQTDPEDEPGCDPPGVIEDKVDALVRAAASLIAVCAGTAAARTLTRTFVFPCPRMLSGQDISVELTDVPIAADAESATVGTQTWGSACLLAEMLAEDPARFGLGGGGETSGEGVRALELGAGTGLVSLACAKLLSATTLAGLDETKTTLVATDYHPTVLSNLQRNIAANFPGGTPSSLSFSAHALDWSRYGLSVHDGLAPASPTRPFDEPFDVILGADVIYEPEHTYWIRDCVSALLRRPAILEDGAPHCHSRFHLVIPQRPTHTLESRAVEEAFPTLSQSSERGNSQFTLCVLEKETILCEVEEARPCVEVEYVHYTIGWA